MTVKYAMLSALALCAAQAFAAETHSVTFRRMNGTVLSKIEVEHGANASGLVPALPAEADMTARTWDCADRLASVTNDVTCWALYEASTAKSPSTSIASQSVVDRTTPYSLEEYFQIYDNLAWSDEFSGTSLSVASYSWFSNGKNWLYDTEQRNGELQKYTTTGGNHIVSDGTLKLRAKRESSGGKSFTSGSIRSQGTVAFRYGRCEIRAKLTKQKGTWPAFWLMSTSGGWPDCGELDVFEQINGSDWIGGTFHIPDGTGVTFPNSALAGPEDGTHWGDAFHRIGVIMTEFECVWYVDDHIFKRMDVRNKTRYPMTDGKSWYILLNLAFGGGWPGQTSADDASIAGFQSEDFEIDYCRIFTNTTAGNTVSRGLEPEVARLSGPVKATVWRGWQMKYGKAGANYFQNHLIGEVGKHIKTAMREYFTRDGADIVTFLTRPDENTGSTNLANPFDVPGVSTLSLSPEAGGNYNATERDRREKLLTTVMFDRNRFSPSDSAISSLPLTNDANYTNCCAVVAELVEKDSGAKVKVVSVNLSQTNGTDYATLFDKLNQFKNERTILLFQSMDSAYHTPLKNQASSKLDKAYKYLGEYKVWPTYQFSYATTNCVSATATNPAPLSVPKSNGQASGVHTNHAYCATVQFEAEPQIEYGQLDMSAFSKKMDVTFSGYSGTTLTDFPVLVKLSTAISGFSYGDFQKTNGGDLRFADSTGKLLPHEIDTWNPSGVSTVWVKVPSLTANGKITACYGCAEPPEVAAKDVWDSGYVGVWHLGESAVPMKESSETSSDFTQSNGNGIGFGADGIVGGSVDFGESGKSRALIAPDHDALDGFSQCTFEAWTFVTNRTSGSDVNKGLLSKRINYNNEASYYLHDTGSATKFYISANGTSSTDMSTNVKADENAWTHQVYTFDGGGSDNNVGAWKNGVDVGKTSKSVASVNAGSAPLYLGNFGPSGSSIDARNFPGKIDEVRISKCVRSADWIKATHDTIANAAFATYAVDGIVPEEPPAPQVVSASDAAGFDYTNRLVTVTGLSAGETVTLVVARAGTTTAMTATADANGEAVFNVATAPGAVYSYAVSRDGTELASGGFVTGGWKSGGSWFRGAFAAGAPVASGGSWTGTPQLTANGSAVAGDTQFALSAAARAAGSEKFARVEFDFKCEGMDDEVSLAADLAPMFGGVSTVALSAGGTAWFAWDGTAWHRLYGEAAPEVGGAYVVRAELDLAASPKTVRYFVSSDGGGTFAPLFADAELADEWIACRAAPSDCVGEVAVEGSLELASVAGALMGADIAEAEGTGYESLADALAAGGEVKLLTNATWPTNAPVGTVAVDHGGFALQGVALDGSGHAVVQSGHSAIPGEGRINISLAQAAALGVATNGKTPAEIASALAADGANGIPLWKSYALGLDPSDPDSKPKAAIAVSGGKVELSLVGIDVNASSGATVTYKVCKAAELTDVKSVQPLADAYAVGETAAITKDAPDDKMFYQLKIDVKAAQ